MLAVVQEADSPSITHKLHESNSQMDFKVTDRATSKDWNLGIIMVAIYIIRRIKYNPVKSEKTLVAKVLILLES